MTSIIFMILLQVVLIGLNAIFACAEIAVISVNDNKLNKMAEEGDKRAVRLKKLTSQSARFLSTIQIAITLSGFLGSAFAAENFSDGLTSWLLKLGVPVSAKVLDSIAVIVITIVLSYFTLIFGELVPKQIAMRKSESMALGLSGLLSAIAKIFAPLVQLLTVSTNGVLRLLGIDPNAEEENVSEEEIRMMVDAGSEKGTIDREEREFIENVFEFDDLTAEEIATHRTDVVMLDMDGTADEWKEIIFHSMHTQYPIYQGLTDNIVGVLNAKEYLRMENATKENVLETAVHSPYCVPETISADVLFRNMKKEKQVMAVVMDEYGGMTGIVTLNDLVEELVGDLGDDDEPEDSEMILQTGEQTWLVSGSARLEDVSEAIGVSLDCEDYDTLNGLIFHTLESIPEQGNDLEVQVGEVRIRITKMENRQVEQAEIQVRKPETEEDEQE